METRDIINASSSKDTSQLLFLSLFLLLIAFFILLNSLSTIEESRSRKVMSSVTAAFRVTLAPNADSPVVIADLGPSAEPERLLAAMEQLWVTSVQLQDVRTLAPGRAMEVTMPANQPFLVGSATLRRLGGVLENIGNRIDIYGHAQPVTRGQGEQEHWRSSLRRAEAVANELKRIGIERNITILGLGQSRYKHLHPGLPAVRRRGLANRVDIVIHPMKEEP